MMLMCIPMALVTVGLVITGVAGAGTLVLTGMCMVVMWLMMRAMP